MPAVDLVSVYSGIIFLLSYLVIFSVHVQYSFIQCRTIAKTLYYVLDGRRFSSPAKKLFSDDVLGSASLVPDTLQ